MSWAHLLENIPLVFFALVTNSADPPRVHPVLLDHLDAVYFYNGLLQASWSC